MGALLDVREQLWRVHHRIPHVQPMSSQRPGRGEPARASCDGHTVHIHWARSAWHVEEQLAAEEAAVARARIQADRRCARIEGGPKGALLANLVRLAEAARAA